MGIFSSLLAPPQPMPAVGPAPVRVPPPATAAGRTSGRPRQEPAGSSRERSGGQGEAGAATTPAGGSGRRDPDPPAMEADPADTDDAADLPEPARNRRNRTRKRATVASSPLGLLDERLTAPRRKSLLGE